MLLLPICLFTVLFHSHIYLLSVKFETFDILQDPEIREGLKKYSDWPTYPQLYLNAELVGGLDVVRVSMYVIYAVCVFVNYVTC